MSSHHHNSNNNTSERIPMLMKATSNDTLLTPLSSAPKNEKFSPPHKYYDMRPLTAKLSSSNSSSSSSNTNGLIINNYGINNKNSFMTRICCHMMKGVQRNIQKCVAALVLISFFSIILFTQYMDSSSPLVG